MQYTETNPIVTLRLCPIENYIVLSTLKRRHVQRHDGGFVLFNTLNLTDRLINILNQQHVPLICGRFKVGIEPAMNILLYNLE